MKEIGIIISYLHENFFFLAKSRPPIFVGKKKSLFLNEVVEDSFIHWV